MVGTSRTSLEADNNALEIGLQKFQKFTYHQII